MDENNKDSFLVSLRKDLEQELERLKTEKKEEKEKSHQEAAELVRKELAEAERKHVEKTKELETKLKQLYYWLFAITLAYLALFVWVIYL
jgi:hypothetical protein